MNITREQIDQIFETAINTADTTLKEEYLNALETFSKSDYSDSQKIAYATMITSRNSAILIVKEVRHNQQS